MECGDRPITLADSGRSNPQSTVRRARTRRVDEQLWSTRRDSCDAPHGRPGHRAKWAGAGGAQGHLRPACVRSRAASPVGVRRPLERVLELLRGADAVFGHGPVDVHRCDRSAVLGPFPPPALDGEDRFAGLGGELQGDRAMVLEIGLPLGVGDDQTSTFHFPRSPR